jgi:5'-3' exonuclease
MATPTYLLLDADITAYWFAYIGQDSIKWDDEITSTFHTKELYQVCAEADAKIAEFKAYIEADEVIVCLSCASEDGWRRKLLPSYKANRGAKPLYLAAVKDHMRSKYRTFEKPTLEADDVLGILSTHPTILPGRKIVVSTDKDLKTIPGWLWNPDKDKQPHEIHRQDADYWHLYQTLVGDATDNYKGCPGIGPKKAAQLLKDGDDCRYFSLAEMWERIVAAYARKGLTEADALVQARVARIARCTDYDFKRKEIILWEPPQSPSSPSSPCS